MTKNRSLVYGAALPQDFLDSIQELLGTYISPNMVATVLNTTTIQLAAGTDNAQITLAINGRWRYVTTAVNATHPGGSAGIYALWATASDNSFAIGPPEVDSTVYDFALEIRASGTPGTALSRQIGYVEWNGSAITNVRLLGDDSATRATLEPGDYILSASATRQGALLCDGASYLRTAFPALFNALGGTSSPYGLPDGTHFNVPDCRGRSLIGAGTGAGLTLRTAGGTGGEERHTLSAAESGVPAHTHPSGGTGAGTTGTGTTGTGTTGTGTTGTGTTGTGNTGTGTTGVDSPDHNHNDHFTAGSVAGAGTLAPVASGVANNWDNQTGGANQRHAHSVPALSVPGLSVPGLNVPGLSVPGLSVPSLTVSITDPSTPANTPAAASTSHENMSPWLAGFVFVKT
jgi:microcystin-dependent protein